MRHYLLGVHIVLEDLVVRNYMNSPIFSMMCYCKFSNFHVPYGIVWNSKTASYNKNSKLQFLPCESREMSLYGYSS